MSEEYVVECPGYFLELFKEIKPEKATREHIFCTKDVIARMVFDTPDASISVTKNLDIVEVKGEVRTQRPKEVEREIESITTQGAWGTKATPCKVVERHVHEYDGTKIHHIHFACTLFLESPEILKSIIKKIEEIASKY